MCRAKPKNIYIIGAQSTGKTTIVDALKAEWGKQEEQESRESNSGASEEEISEESQQAIAKSDAESTWRWRRAGGEVPKPKIIRELARTVLERLNVTRDHLMSDPSCALDVQRHILNAQCEIENRFLAAERDAWFISDRSGADPLVYAALFAGTSAVQTLLASSEWRDVGARMKEGAVFVCEAGTAWLIDDGVRAMPRDMDEWNRVDASFRDILTERGIEFTVIPRTLTNLTERVGLVIETWNND